MPIISVEIFASARGRAMAGHHQQHRDHPRKDTGFQQSAAEIEARAMDHLRRLLAPHPWALTINVEDGRLGRVIVLRATDTDAAYLWRDNFGPSYAHLRILVRPHQPRSGA